MAQKITASIPDSLDLDQSWTVRFTAIDAASGAQITAVKVSAANLLVANLSGGTADELAVAPLWIPIAGG